MRALIEDDGTRVIMLYAEAIGDPEGFVSALGEARERRKPVVILKGGATEASGRAALAHTGRLAGSDRTYDTIFREFALSAFILRKRCSKLRCSLPRSRKACFRAAIAC
jgi:acetyltransferase